MKNFFLISLLIFVFLIIFYSKCNSETFSNLGNNKILWDGKMTTTNTVINNLKKEWANCGFYGFDLKPNDLSIINSKKRLIELLPSTNMIGKLDYQKIKCFVNKYDPENYVVISKTITNVPKILKPVNIIIVNNMLYQSTPFGVLKYQVSRLSNLNKNTSLNASIESSVINEYNIFNSSFNPIFIINGKILQKIQNKILDLKNNDEYIFRNINNKIEIVNKNSMILRPSPPIRRPSPPIRRPRPPIRRPSPPIRRPRPPTRRPSPPTRRPSPPTRRPSPPTRRPSPPTRRPSPPTRRPSPPTRRPRPPTRRPRPPTRRPSHKNKTKEKMSNIEQEYNLEEMSNIEQEYNLEEMSNIEQEYNLEEMSNIEQEYNLEEMSNIEQEYNLEEMSNIEQEYNLEEMSNIEQEYNLEEMSNNRLNLNKIVPIVKTLPGQKLEDIKKAAKAEANKRLIQTIIMKEIDKAQYEIKNASILLKKNPNNPMAKKILEISYKKLGDIEKEKKELIKSSTSKNNLDYAKLEAKIAERYFKNNKNDANAFKVYKDTNKKLANIQKTNTNLLIQKSLIKDLEKAKNKAIAATNFFNKNPKDPYAKKLVDEMNKKYQHLKQSATKLINKRDNNKFISKQQKKELSIKINEIDLNKILDNLVTMIDYDGVLYICQSDSVRPLSIWALKLNEIIKKNKLILLTVIPHFYYLDNKFNYVLIFVFNDDFCVILNKENLSQVLDVKSVIGVSFNQNIPDKLNCDDLKVILEQMTRGNVISANKSKSLLKRYKC